MSKKRVCILRYLSKKERSVVNSYIWQPVDSILRNSKKVVDPLPLSK